MLQKNKPNITLHIDSDILILVIYNFVINTIFMNIYSYIISTLFVLFYICMKFKSSYDKSLIYMLFIVVFSGIYISFFNCYYSIDNNIKKSHLINTKIEIIINTEYEITINRELIVKGTVIKQFKLNNDKDFQLFYHILKNRPILVIHTAKYSLDFYNEIKTIIEIKEF